MKKKALVKLLKAVPDDFEIILAKDREGNDFSPLDEISNESYVATTTWYGELGEDGEINAIVLWPVN